MATACCISPGTSARSRSPPLILFWISIQALKLLQEISTLISITRSPILYTLHWVCLTEHPRKHPATNKTFKPEEGRRHFTGHIRYATTTTSRLILTCPLENSSIARHRTRNFNAQRWRSEHLLFQMSEDGLQLNPLKIAPHFHPVNSKSIILLVGAL